MTAGILQVSAHFLTQRSGNYRDIVQGIVEEIQRATLLYEWLKDKPIDIGQIQFWGMGMNYFAPVVESADAVKVFLRISEQEEEEIYKLVLEKTDQMDWEPIS